MTLVNDYAPLMLRVFLVVLFPFSGLDKIVNWGAAMKQAGTVPYAPAMLLTAILVELSPQSASSPAGTTAWRPSCWPGSAS